jgi:anti-sigma factor RsiW
VTVKNEPNAAATPLDLEQLAAYLDGRLTPQERAAVEERLAEDEDAFELFAEAARLAETAAAPAGEVVDLSLRGMRLRGNRRAATRWIGPLAAAAVVLLALGLATLQPWRGLSSVPSATWVAALPAGDDLAAVLGDRWTEAAWSEYRSAPGPLAYPLFPPEVAAFRIGARTVDLAAALRAEDADTASSLAAQLESLYPNLESTTAATIVMAQLALTLEQAGPQAAAQDLATLDEHHGVEPASYYETGRWAESARLAARAGARPFFESRLWSRGLRALQRQAQTPELRQLAERLPGSAPPDFAALVTELDAVIALLGNGDARLAPPTSD